MLTTELRIFTTYIASPLGWLEINGTQEEVTSIKFCESKKDDDDIIPNVILECKHQLQEYFKGKRNSFDFAYTKEGTEFQKKVWDELEKIPFGTTLSYLDIAKQIGDENASRAVGTANGKNKIAIVIPCHRVIGSDNKLVGYAGGMSRKQWLLQHEAKFHKSPNTLF